MKWGSEFVSLDKAIHDRASFSCGEEELDDFIKKYAAKHMEANISKTMVLPASKKLANSKYPLCSFYTIAPGSLERETLPPSRRNKLPYYPVPVFRIAELAVNSSCQGKGIGKITLIKALEHLWGVNANMRAYAVIVDCLNETKAPFYSQYGFEILGRYGDRLRMFLPMQTVGMLLQES